MNHKYLQTPSSDFRLVPGLYDILEYSVEEQVYSDFITVWGLKYLRYLWRRLTHYKSVKSRNKTIGTLF